jgi:hypothetical protein
MPSVTTSPFREMRYEVCTALSPQANQLMGWAGLGWAIPAQRGSSLVGGVLVAQRAQPAGQVGKLEGVPAVHGDVLPYER